MPTADARLRVLERLAELNITYGLYEHPAVFTAEEAAAHWSGVAGAQIKNLFLRNKKGNRHYLVVLGVGKQADLRHLAGLIGDDRLSFGSPDRLMRLLGVTPGSVSPFGLINDTARAVEVVVDRDLRAAERLIFHPNDNTASLTITAEDFSSFLDRQGNRVRWVRL